MKYFFKLLFILAVACFSSFSYSLAQTATFDIEVLQFGKNIPASAAHEIKLKRAPFVLKIRLKGIKEVYYQAAFSDSMFIKPADAPIDQFEDIPAMSMGEEQFNEAQTLIIRSDAWHCWFYDPELDWHRFDKEGLIVKRNEVIAFKTISKFLIIDDTDFNDPQRFERKVSEPNPGLYLFFLSAREQNGQSHLGKELDRYALKLSWID